jgi:hypothetical protein
MRLSPVVQSLTEPLLSPLVSAITGVFGGGFSPTSLFADGSKGVVYDNNDLSSFFLDSALTTPATVNGLVGGQLDKSGNGFHRTQATTGSKPVLRGTPTGANLVTNGDFASGTGWTAGAGWAIGSGVATATTSSGTLTSTLAATASKNYRVTYTITRSAGSVQVSFGGRTGASRSAAGTYVDYLDSTTNTNALVFTGTTFSGTVDNVEVVDVSAGQVTAPYGLQYDGVDDFLQTAAVNFTATDKMFVCAGVRKLSDAAQGIVVELSGDTGSNNGSFRFTFPGGAGANTYAWLCKGTVASSVTASGYIAPITNVVSGIADIAGDSCLLRVNGVQVNQSTSDQGTGNFGNYVLYFGRRAGAAVPYNGLDFGFVICGKTLTSTQIANTERWMSYRTGVTL